MDGSSVPKSKAEGKIKESRCCATNGTRPMLGFKEASFSPKTAKNAKRHGCPTKRLDFQYDMMLLRLDQRLKEWRGNTATDESKQPHDQVPDFIVSLPNFDLIGPLRNVPTKTPSMLVRRVTIIINDVKTNKINETRTIYCKNLRLHYQSVTSK